MADAPGSSSTASGPEAIAHLVSLAGSNSLSSAQPDLVAAASSSYQVASFLVDLLALAKVALPPAVSDALLSNPDPSVVRYAVARLPGARWAAYAALKEPRGDDLLLDEALEERYRAWAFGLLDYARDPAGRLAAFRSADLDPSGPPVSSVFKAVSDAAEGLDDWDLRTQLRRAAKAARQLDKRQFAPASQPGMSSSG